MNYIACPNKCGSYARYFEMVGFWRCKKCGSCFCELIMRTTLEPPLPQYTMAAWVIDEEPDPDIPEKMNAFNLWHRGKMEIKEFRP